MVETSALGRLSLDAFLQISRPSDPEGSDFRGYSATVVERLLEIRELPHSTKAPVHRAI
jgi:hypothetical protein